MTTPIRVWLLATLLGVASAAQTWARDTHAAAGLVDIRELAPDIALDIRYAGPDNFVGARIDGYGAPRCLLLRPVAQALARVEQTLRAQQQRLLIFDCYRPQRAVAHFMRWASDLPEQSTRAAYYPRIEKSALVPDYIAAQSGHSRADTVDLTLQQCDRSLQQCVSMDMGTPFDFFDPRANTDSAEVSAAQRAARQQLRQAMSDEGFANYPLEWWHYSLRDADDPVVYFDVPIEAAR
jgi:D-alanyl-D-alanine dipeptidase